MIKTRRQQVLEVFGFDRKYRDTRDFPYWGDRFTAYRRGTKSDYERARRAYIMRYGLSSWNKDILPRISGDRLGIFRSKPTKKTMFFANRLAWSSEQRIKEYGKLGKIIHKGFR
jgi:hypothetical protein